MSDLDQVKGLLAQGDNEKAVVQLASILMQNRNDVDAWLLMGEIIDDPAKKKDCYNRVLKLAPGNLVALMRLQELETQPSGHPIASSEEAETGSKRPLNKSRRNLHFVPNQTLYSPGNASKNDDSEILSYFLVGVVSFLVILYVLVTGNFSNNIFCGGLLFLGISTGTIILLLVNKNRI